MILVFLCNKSTALHPSETIWQWGPISISAPPPLATNNARHTAFYDGVKATPSLKFRNNKRDKAISFCKRKQQKTCKGIAQ